jgi:DNA topoisomerase-3
VAVKRALGKLEDNAAYAGLRDAALGRGRADWLYGLNLTRLYTVKGRASGHTGVLSVGRVQTPVLGLVVRRDREIEAFVSKPFYELTAELAAAEGTFTAHWVPAERYDSIQDEEGRIIDRETVERMAQSLLRQPGSIDSVKTQHKGEPPPLPFSLPELQKVASKGQGLSPKKTLDVAQSLYEKHQVLTYPRSDCRYLPIDHWGEGGVVRDAIVHSVGKQHALYPLTDRVNLIHRGHCWNDDKVSAHHAIIPTSKWVPLDTLTADERWLYEVVAHRYLLQFCADREYDQTDVIASVDSNDGPERFKARGRVESAPGWRQYSHLLMNKTFQHEKLPADQEVITPLPPLRQGESLRCESTQVHDKQTTPPKHFTEGSLLEAMTSIARYVQDPALKKILRDTDGLGTPATQAGIIDILFKRAYLEKQRTLVVATALGREMVDTLPEAITLPDMTAHWEMQLARIAEEGADLASFLAGVTDGVRKLTASAITQGNLTFSRSTSTTTTVTPKTKPEGQTYPCPGETCEGQLRRIKGKKGFFWGCSNYGQGCREARQDARGKPAKAQVTRQTTSVSKHPVVAVGKTCPECKKGKIQRRSLKSGNHAGKPFHGCSTFPKCRYFAWPAETVDEASA